MTQKQIRRIKVPYCNSGELELEFSDGIQTNILNVNTNDGLDITLGDVELKDIKLINLFCDIKINKGPLKGIVGYINSEEGEVVIAQSEEDSEYYRESSLKITNRDSFLPRKINGQEVDVDLITLSIHNAVIELYTNYEGIVDIKLFISSISQAI